MKKTHKYLLLFACLTAIFSFSSCKKKWKQPTDVSFKFLLNSNSNTGLVKFTNAYLFLNKISYTGDRKQSPTHIELQQQLNGLPINFSSGSASSALKFEIPQGTYSKIDIKYETISNQNATSLEINGTYVDSSGNTIAVQFIFPAADGITLTAKNASGGNEIVLIEGHPVTANITLNPNYWFASIPKSIFNDAEVEDKNGVQTISIDKDNNEDLYNLIVNRIKDGNECVFN